MRVTVPGHIQRGGQPCPYDRVLSTRIGAGAAEAISGRGVRSDDRCGKRQDQARTAGRMCRKAENGFAEGSDGKGCQTDWNQFW